MNIFEKMAAITADLKTVAKNLDVSAGKSSYKAVSERDVLDAVKPLENKYKVYSYPHSRETLESEQLESESTYNGNTTKKTTFYTRIKTIYRFVNAEKPEEYIDMTVFSVGLDPQDKGDGKAMTYADKYALMKAYKISTGDDPDQDGSEDTDYTKKPSAKKTSDKPSFKCEVCGNVLQPYTDSKGNTVSLRAHAERSQAKFGKVMCIDCITKLNESKNS